MNPRNGDVPETDEELYEIIDGKKPKMNKSQLQMLNLLKGDDIYRYMFNSSTKILHIYKQDGSHFIFDHALSYVGTGIFGNANKIL